MFDLFKKKSPAKIEGPGPYSDGDNERDGHKTIAAGFAATGSAMTATQQAAERFAKPARYTGNRVLYDDGAAKRQAKAALFDQGKMVRDPYTGDVLALTKKEAKALYGSDWTKHLAETDHIKPLEQLHADTLSSPWVTTDDIKAAGNSPDNIRVISRKTNNAKRSKTNEQLVGDTEYREAKGVEFTAEGERMALHDGEAADYSIRRQLGKASAKNIIETGHKAGMSGAQNAGATVGAMSVFLNIVAVVKGEKGADEAIIDTARDAGQAAVTGYAMAGGLTTVSHSLSNSKSKFIQDLVKLDVPGKVVTAVMAVGDTFKRYMDGEISTQECMIELGERGLNLTTMGYSMTMGQALIPIPIIGGAIGALVGATLTSGYYHSLIDTLQRKEFEHQERLRIIAECKEAAEQAKAFRLELESYLREYFKEYRDCFDEAIVSMQFSFQTGDADGIIAGANQITRKLGGQVHYETVEGFKDFFDNTTIDII